MVHIKKKKKILKKNLKNYAAHDNIKATENPFYHLKIILIFIL